MENQVVLSTDSQNAEKSVIIYRSEDGNIQLEVQLVDDNVWLTQNQMTILFETTKQNISLHIANILKDEELDNRTIKKILTVQNEGGRQIKRKINVYNLDMIIAVGYRVNSKRGTLFRQWANRVLKQYLLRGYAIDSSRVLVTQE